MSLLGRVQSRLPAPEGSPRITVVQIILFVILLTAVFTRFWRLGVPDQCYFDEVYFPTTGAEILKGDNRAWDFYGHENTHPPLSKELMALGMAIFGHADKAGDNGCWGDAEDEPKRTDPSWQYDPIGWRFFGALAGVGAVLFMYLLGRRLLDSEVAGLAAAALLTFDGVALAQARIATPDTYVLFFTLGALYFLTKDRFLLSGLFFGAASATKWIGAFTLGPIVLYLIYRLIKGIRETEPDERMREVEGVMKVGARFGALAVAAGAVGWAFAAVGLLDNVLDGIDVVIGPLMGLLGAEVPEEGFVGIAFLMAAPLVICIGILGAGVAAILIDAEWRSTPRGRLYIQTAAALPLFFIVVPGLVYVATYIPMLANGHAHGFLGLGGLQDVWDLNVAAYNFHSHLTSPHGYSSDWYEWPIMRRPIYLYVNGSGDAKIYSFGNPALFWLAIPALGFLLLRVWQGLNLRFRILDESGRVHVSGAFRLAQWPLLFVALSYLLVWLPWATQPRVLFIYHYLPALTFAVLALGYATHCLWRSNREWGRVAALGVVGLIAVTFVYFYPHWTAINVSRALEDSYYWFNTWR